MSCPAYFLSCPLALTCSDFHPSGSGLHHTHTRPQPKASYLFFPLPGALSTCPSLSPHSRPAYMSIFFREAPVHHLTPQS